MKIIVLLAACWLCVPSFAQPVLVELAPQARALRQQHDLEAVARYRQGLEQALAYVRAKPEIFQQSLSAPARMLSIEERSAVRRMWQGILDYYLALDALRRYHGEFAALKDRRERRQSFRVTHAAYLAAYSNALALTDAFSRNPHLDPLLNEAMPELGLPASSYDRFRLRFLNVMAATEFAALEVIRKSLGVQGTDAADAAVRQDAAAIFKAGKGQGHAMTVANGFNVVRKTAHATWFPAQAGVAEWMGDVKVYRTKRSLVLPQQIAALAPLLEPGDILLARREWYLSNIGLPGFWPHAALYVGTPEERARYFDDPAVRAWVRAEGEPSGSLEHLLRARFPHAYPASLAAREHGHVPRVLEAISEGVSSTTLEHAADADSLAVLRPRRAKLEKAMAVLRAFNYAGRPYDFDFDFRTDSALVCTELIFKAYEAATGMRGLQFPLVDIMGRLATPANEMVRQFDAQYGSAEQQTDLVLFLDGQERKGVAVNASLDEFRQSWQRPKWHVLAAKQAAAPIQQTAGAAGQKR